MKLTNTSPGLEKINDEILNDDLYPVDRRFKHEFGWGPFGKIMFIGQCPAFTNSQGAQGTSDFDKFFFKLIGELGIQPLDFYFTNLVKIPVSIKEVPEDTLEHCAKYLIKEVEVVKPKVIFGLGKYAYQFSRKAGIKVYPVMHPAAIRYGNATEEQWQTEFRALLNKLNVSEILGKEIK